MRTALICRTCWRGWLVYSAKPIPTPPCRFCGGGDVNARVA